MYVSLTLLIYLAKISRDGATRTISMFRQMQNGATQINDCWEQTENRYDSPAIFINGPAKGMPVQRNHLYLLKTTSRTITNIDGWSTIVKIRQRGNHDHRCLWRRNMTLQRTTPVCVENERLHDRNIICLQRTMNALRLCNKFHKLPNTKHNCATHIIDFGWTCTPVLRKLLISVWNI